MNDHTALSPARAQVIFHMTSTLLQFGAVMLVVMIGFTMALHVLFRDLEDFSETLLKLFEAMLGGTEIFGDFSGGRYDTVATILVVVYLFIVTIMLLNLLIAILSTSHARVQESAGGTFKVSKARIIDHYGTVVDEDLLPTPFNLMQLVVSMAVFFVTFLYFFPKAKKEHPDVYGRAFWRKVCEAARERGKRAKRAFGVVMFWFVLGLVAVTGEAILWGLSGFSYAQYVLYVEVRSVLYLGFNSRADFTRGSSRMLQGVLIALACSYDWGLTSLAWFLILLWCILVAPLWLFFYVALSACSGACFWEASRFLLKEDRR